MSEYSKINAAPLVELLVNVCPPLLNTTRDEISKHFTGLEAINKIKQFVGDEGVLTLLVSREPIEQEKDDKLASKKKQKEEADQEDDVTYRTVVELEVSCKAKGASTMLFLKKSPANFRIAYEGGKVDGAEQGPSASRAGNAGFVAQLHWLCLATPDDGTPFELMLSYVQNCFAPLVQTLQSERSEEADASAGAGNVHKKIGELALALQQCGQQLDIQEIQLAVAPEIQEAFDKAKAEGKEPSPDEFQERLNDPAYLSSLQSGVNKWAKEISKITKLEKDAFSARSAVQEINFWLALEKALADVQKQLQSPEIQFTLNLLKSARRFLATMSFETDTGLKPAMEKVANYLSLMRDFPINDLLVASSIEQLNQAVRQVFNHMKRMKNATQYPLWRAYNLVESVSRDLAAQILRILAPQKLMIMDYELFEQNVAGSAELFRVWDDEVRQFKELIRDLLKKRGTNERPPLKLTFEHAQLQERLVEVHKFRRQHTKLVEVISKVLSDQGKDTGAQQEVAEAYRLMETVDVLDVSRRGQQAWESTKKRYDERIDRAESEITARLRDKLGAAKTATEMFRVFSRFNALFVRPRIRGAIQEYQTNLIQQVKDDIRRLQEKFLASYESTQASVMSSVRDIPSTSGVVIWVKQLERRLHVYMKRVEDVLGRGWEQHVEGQKLKQEGDAFAKKMSAAAIFEQWIKERKEGSAFDVRLRIFNVQPGYNNSLELLVNFDEQIITLFKEVRNLQALQFRVPYAVKVSSDEAKLNYPFAMTLQEATRTYMQTCAKITPTIAPMIAATQSAVQQQIFEGLPMRWESGGIEAYTRKLSEQVFQFEHKVTEILSLTEQMDLNIEGLSSVDIKGNSAAKEQIEASLEKMQKMIDDMNLASYSNLEDWVAELCKRIEARLVKVLARLIDEWVVQFEQWPRKGTSLITEGIYHELQIHNHVITLEPPKENARMRWAQHLHDSMGIILNLPRLQARRFDALQRRAGTSGLSNHKALLAQMEQALLKQAYDSIDKMVKEMEEYTSTWLQYQSLWEINATSVLEQLGDDLDKWHQMLTEIKTSTSRFDSHEQERSFGPIFVDYKPVQSKVKTKCDLLHREILNEFGTKVGEDLTQFYSAISLARTNLERLDSSGDPTSLVMVVQSVKRQSQAWTKKLDGLRAAQSLLERQRYQFGEDWLPLDRVEGEWEAFSQILEKKNRILERELPNLKAALMSRDRQVEEQITVLYAEWSSQKPVAGAATPSSAMEVIQAFDERLQKIRSEFDQLMQAKESLGLEVSNPEVLEPLQDEMSNLKSVWMELNSVYSKVEALKEMLWTAVVPKKVRAQLDEILTNLKNMPSKLRQYEAFGDIQEQINTYLKLNMMISDMKSEAVKERHWKQISQKLKITMRYNEVTLGHLWDANLQKNESDIRAILSAAQGEMGLEEFLRGVREHWTTFEVELVPYKSKCRLIRGWDDLFEQIDEHLNNLQSMKNSPYFKSFEEEGGMWDDRLNKFRIVFDIWMDVQRRWVYLEGILYGSADIQQLLPNEYNQFRTIDNEFIGLMKKVVNKPKVIDIITIDGLQKLLDKTSDRLRSVQKALGDYLERQRSQFARFYFVGDEDLLEMIGNSRDVIIVSRHLAKMFAGIALLEVEEGASDIVEGMTSREGEEVKFSRPVRISDDPSINAWLARTEKAMQSSLADQLNTAVTDMNNIFSADGQVNATAFLDWVGQFPCQDELLAISIDYCQRTETAFSKGAGPELDKLLQRCIALLGWMADQVLKDIDKHTRQKLAQMIIEVVHQRDVSRELIRDKVSSARSFLWLQSMRMYWNTAESNQLEKLTIKMADASFFYGFEYLGIAEKLVQTPLTDRCFLTLTQALHMRLGGNPFGPAGTGKTESVKALGNVLGRFVLVFCCDEGFDFQAMGRILIGLCQVGAWGCFDEFNRLEERILSAVSEQILTIQTGNKARRPEIELLGKPVRLNSNVGIFVTMNPGYAGRSNLPDNLKQLFRAMAMIKPDKNLIAQVNLYNQGFRTAERLAGKIVSLFDLCGDQLSSQPHYDFGLRSLKAVLASAGALKRETVAALGDKAPSGDSEIANSEQEILLRSVFDTLVPKLVAQDKPLIESLITGVFPGADVGMLAQRELQEEIKRLCQLRHFECSNNFMEKCMQLYQIQKITHGVMMVGTVGTGKSSVWRTLLDAMEKLDGIKGDSYIVDPKAVTKEELYGKMDSTTLEWTDGVFTDILRRVLTGLRGEKDRRQWIVFDGDVDPEWAENLNSVLDDNKLLTLPNGERLAIPPNVRIMFEVETLKYATLATVSRCGMVWFPDDIVTPHMICANELRQIKYGDLEAADKKRSASPDEDRGFMNKEEAVKAACVDILSPFFEVSGLVLTLLDISATIPHIMSYTHIRCITALFGMLRKGINMVIEYNEQHEDFPLAEDKMQKFITKYLLFSLCWSLGGDMSLDTRMEYCQQIAEHASAIPMPPGLGGDTTLLDFEVRIEDGEWYPWSARVPTVDATPEDAAKADLIIPTVDTVRHRAALAAWLEEKRPFVLCGPPGSGKSMTLMSTLKALPNFELASLNFSSGTSPELLLKTLSLYCECVKTPAGFVMRPQLPGKWLVVFCDEINLPEEDKYGTQRVIMWIRQATEAGGFYRPADKAWISLERVQFLGACNPPTDSGRYPLSDRFLRHAPVILVDYPGPDSLRQIYGTFNRAMLKMQPQLDRSLAEAMTRTMVRFYRDSQKQFTVDSQPHYLYSPRELTRWKTAIYEAIRDTTGLTETQLIRLCIHEAMRIFSDRLVYAEEQKWSEDRINDIVIDEFQCGEDAVKRPILFSTYLANNYQEADREELREHVRSKLRIFYEEELSVHLVIFDEVLDHISRMDRVLRQPLGHLLLVGASGAGKTVLTKFVSWMNGLTVYQIKAGRNYDILQFEADVRQIMKRSGVKGEKITFIFDESNALGPAFLERMNALLASGEVPGLFEGDEYTNLIGECKNAGMQGMDDGELFARFTKCVQRNLHIVFTMNPANPDFYNRKNSSPALFNRCVIDWFGDWPREALTQVALDFTSNLQMSESAFSAPGLDEQARHDTLASTIVVLHERVDDINQELKKAAMRYNYITPRDFLDFINHYIELVGEKRDELSDQRSHIEGGLQKLKETEEQVAQLQESLSIREAELSKKNAEANTKMEQMVKGQSEAEEKKNTSEKLKTQLAKAQKEIATRKQTIEADIAEVEPLLEEAKNAVSSLSKASINELQSIAKNPPALVKLTMEAVVLMVKATEKLADPIPADLVMKMIKDPKLITNILEFDPDQMKEDRRQRIQKGYLNNEKWNLDKINHASKAAGPMALWVESQVKYTGILLNLEPMRIEMAKMSKEAETNQQELEAQESQIAQMEKKIKEYKEDYAQLISQVQQIKSEMSSVEQKCARSKQLLTDLGGEKRRWEASSSGFDEQLNTLLGDGLVGGAFATYIGFFDLGNRQRLLSTWRDQLQVASFKFQPDLSIIDYLSKPSERLTWKEQALPDDSLCYENAIILKRYLRYPLVIDPSGQAITFLQNLFKDKRLTKTNFADNNFMKSLESALRFGTPLLVSDVDKVDPVLNSVLNKETYKQGPRVLIRVGDSEIDFSPSFVMFMFTRDSSAQFTPDLCSRVTFVNFTITPSSLQGQCMNTLLKSERPDVDKKRSDLLKLQGEFRVKIRELEDNLLQALSNVQGSILEDEKVIATLEKLKKQSAEIQEQVDQTDVVMQEIEQTSSLYDSAGNVAARVYFLLDSLSAIHTLYRYSLAFFFEVFTQCFQGNDQLNDVKVKDDYEARLKIITKALFLNAFRRVAPGLQECDVLIYALRLAQISADMTAPFPSAELDLLLKGASVDVTKSSSSGLADECKGVLSGKLNDQQLKALQDLMLLPSMQNVPSHMKSQSAAWSDFLDAEEPEKKFPTGWRKDDQVADSLRLLQEALLLKALRPDRTIFALTALVESVFEKGFVELPEFDLKNVVEKDSKASSPIMMVSVPGFDPSIKVMTLAEKQGKQVTSVAMGSEEGFALADKAVVSGSKSGGWVLLKNVHLSIGWLKELEKKFYGINPHANFRLFLTLEFNPKTPANLIRLSRVFVFEPPKGIKASLQRSFVQILPAERTDRPPVERCRLHFLLAFLHAVMLERRQYAPVGWTKKYEFSDADQICGRDIIDAWIDSVSNGGTLTNISPDKIPWDALQSVLAQAVYGGRIDNEFEQTLLKSFVQHLFREESFNSDFSLNSVVSREHRLMSPDARKREQFLAWIEALPPKGSPAWAGLPVHAEQMIRINRAVHTLSGWLSLQGKDDTKKDDGGKKKASGRRASAVMAATAGNWLTQMEGKVKTMLENLPASLSQMQRSSVAVKDPLWRCFDREVEVGRGLQKKIKKDLENLRELCRGQARTTNENRALAEYMNTDAIPPSWRKYPVPQGMTVTEWLSDFKQRVEQLRALQACESFQKFTLWFGGLFFPEAFLTATRQASAMRGQQSLEELLLTAEIGAAAPDDSSFPLKGLFLEGATWKGEPQAGELGLTEELFVALPPMRIRWVHNSSPEWKAQADHLLVPVYLNTNRSNLVCSFRLKVPKDLTSAVWLQRSVCVTLWRG